MTATSTPEAQRSLSEIDTKTSTAYNRERESSAGKLE